MQNEGGEQKEKYGRKRKKIKNKTKKELFAYPHYKITSVLLFEVTVS